MITKQPLIRPRQTFCHGAASVSCEEVVRDARHRAHYGLRLDRSQERMRTELKAAFFAVHSFEHSWITAQTGYVRISQCGDLCLHEDLCGSLRSALMLPSGTSHCPCSLTRSQGDFQFLEVSTSRRGTPYNCVDVPDATSAHIKGARQSLFERLVALGDGLFEIRRPNHSECLARRREVP